MLAPWKKSYNEPRQHIKKTDTEQVSLEKKKKSVHHRHLCVRVEIRHGRGQQTEEAITEGTTLEATGSR